MTLKKSTYTIPTVKHIQNHLKIQAKKDNHRLSGIDYEFGYLRVEDDERYKNRKTHFASALRNTQSNRYCDVLPNDHSRIRLEDLHNDYINANFIPGSKFSILHNRANFIASQGPLKQTSAEFWYMCFRFHVPCIVMLCNDIERGATKCHRYWPAPNSTHEFSLTMKDESEQTLTVESVHEKWLSKDYGIIDRQFKIKFGTQEHSIRQLQYVGWPDHGVPSDTQAFGQLLKYVLPYCDEHDPVLLHCSAGIGRTGSLCVIAILALKLKYFIEMKEKDPSLKDEYFDFEVFDTVRTLRSLRSGCVQTLPQYVFIYQCLHDFAQSIGYEYPL